MNTSGLDHIVCSVTDLNRSRDFYGGLLGFKIVDFPDDYPNSIFAGSFLITAGDVEIVFIHHPETNPQDRFSELRVGLDHLSFKAPDEASLHLLVERLLEAGVETNGVETFFPSQKRYVAFRDPDHIQLEYWLDQPAA